MVVVKNPEKIVLKENFSFLKSADTYHEGHEDHEVKALNRY